METKLREARYSESPITLGLNNSGLGLTYASKLFRFLELGNNGALDTRIRKSLKDGRIFNLHNIVDGGDERTGRGYVEFVQKIGGLSDDFNNSETKSPTGGRWKANHVEMTVFQFCSNNSAKS